MQERGASSTLAVTIWAAGVLTVLFAVAQALDTLGLVPKTDPTVPFVYFAAAAVRFAVIVGVRRRLRERPGEPSISLALGLLVAGAVCLVAAALLSTVPGPWSDALVGIFFFAQPAAILAACVGLLQLPGMPRWTVVCGALGGLMAIGSLAARALAANPPTWLSLGIIAISAPLALCLWWGLWRAIASETYLPGRVVALGQLFLTAGLFSLFSALSSALTKSTFELLPVLGIAQLGVGRGLLRGRRSSRRWAAIWLAGWVLAAALVAVVGTIRPGELTANMLVWKAKGTAAIPWVWAFLGVTACFAGFVGYMLYTPSVSHYVEWSEQARAGWLAAAGGRPGDVADIPAEQAHRADAVG